MMNEHIVSDDIGGRLRRAREHRGLSLCDAARLTKLSINVLTAIERNDYASLPGGMFRKAYVRTLAGEVGLDPNEIAADYCARFEPPIAPAAGERQVGRHEKLIQQLAPSPRRSIVTLVALAAAATWFMLQPGPVRPTVALDAAATEFEPAPIRRGAAMTLTADRPRDAAAPGGVAAEKREAPLWIEIEATGWCWVAAETDGARAVYRLVAPGERLVLEAHRMIWLRLGDAGAVTLSINDGPGRSLGRDGAVAELELTPENVDGLRDVAGETVSGD
jgi:cytoskeleton protein RodZ